VSQVPGSLHWGGLLQDLCILQLSACTSPASRHSRPSEAHCRHSNSACSAVLKTRRVPQSAGNHAEGALCAQQAAAALAAAGKPAEAAKWLVRAVRQLRTARMYDECLTLMAQHPEVADSLGATEVRHTLGHSNAPGVMQCEAEEELLNTTRELCLVPASSASGQGHLQLHSSKGSRLLVDIAAVFRGNKQSPSTRRWTRWRASRSQPR